MRFAILLAAVFLLAGCFERQQTAGEAFAEQRNAAAQHGALSGLAATAETGQAALNARADAATAGSAARAATSAADVQRQATQKAKDLAVAQSASNLGPIAAAVRAKQLPVYAETILAQKTTLDATIGLPSAEYPAPQVSLEDLLRDAEASLTVYRRDAEAVKEQLADLSTRQHIAEAAARAAVDRAERAEQAQRTADAKAAAALEDAKAAAAQLQASIQLKEAAEADAKAEARNAFIAKCGAGALALAGPLLLAVLNGATGGGLGALGGLARAFLPAAGRLRDGLETAKVAVASADVGRAAVSRLESLLRISNPTLAEQLGAAVAAATTGRAGSIEGLFKLAAQSHVIDLGGGRAADVHQLLMSVRDEGIETTGGMPDTLTHILQKA